MKTYQDLINDLRGDGDGDGAVVVEAAVAADAMERLLADNTRLREALAELTAATDHQASLVNVETNLEGWNKCLASGERYRAAVVNARAALSSVPRQSEDLVQTPSEQVETSSGHQDTLLDEMAKEVGRLLWHSDPARPFSDEAWAREIKWWNAAKSPNPIEDVREAWYADKCYRVAIGLLNWMAEIEPHLPQHAPLYCLRTSRG